MKCGLFSVPVLHDDCYLRQASVPKHLQLEPIRYLVNIFVVFTRYM
jgi:hypothetical protein